MAKTSTSKKKGSAPGDLGPVPPKQKKLAPDAPVEGDLVQGSTDTAWTDKRTTDEIKDPPMVPGDAETEESSLPTRPLFREGMSDRKSHIVNLRVPMQVVDDIDFWVNNRSYKSRSEFVLAAIRFYLDYLEYRESYNTRTFQRGQVPEAPAERFERLRYLRGNR